LAGWDCAIAALANQPLPWAPNAERVLAERSHDGGLVLAVAALLALVHVRLRRGAPSIARTAFSLGLAGSGALLIAGLLLLTRPGAIEGLARLLAPSADPWGALGTWALWQDAIGLALAAWLPGLGIYTAFGSCLNRSSDVTGLGVVTGLVGALAVLVVTAVGFAAGGVASIGGHAAVGQVGGPPLLMAVPEALVQLPFVAWFIALLATLWFVLVLAFLVPALVALVEAVTAPVVDKFHLPRERVVPAVCLAVFFLAAPLALGDGGLTKVIAAPIVTLVAVLVALHALATWRALTLDALQRHLNAYSAFRLGPVWRVSVSLLVPVAVLTFAFTRWSADPHPWWLTAALVLAAALSVGAARLPARNA
jgi:NSS family neurotransmitter:Na+ symporter